MSLKTDIENWFGGENKWPGDLADEVDCVEIGDEIVDTGRWSTIHEAVFLRKTVSTVDPLTFTEEYVMVTYHEPATELQEWDGFGAPDVAEVKPVEITVTSWERVG